MVGDDIKHHSHVQALKFPGQGIEGPRGPQFCVEFHGVGHGIAMEAAATGLEEGRGVNVSDAQLMQVGRQGFGRGELEVAVEL